MDKKILVILFLIAIVIVSGLTYAWYSWTSTTNTLVTFNIKGAEITYNTSDITKNLIPTLQRTNEKNIIETITVSASYKMYFTLELELTTLEAGLKDASFKYELYEGATELKSGNFLELNQGDIITLLDRSEINTTLRTLILYIWIDGANYDNPTTMQNQNFSFNLRANVTDVQTLANHIIELASINTDEIRIVTHEAITNNTATGSIIPAVTDYRYYSADEDANEKPDPINNYIYYNCIDPSNTDTCEKWRIIGVFYDELTDSNRVKIINPEDINPERTIAWDTANVRAQYGVNAWTATTGTPPVTSDATLNTYLNGTYYNSLSASAKTLTANASWYLGGQSTRSATTSAFYNAERGNEVETSDAYTRATYWEGKIGLMYASDYGYAASDVCVSSTNLGSYDTSCKKTDWLDSDDYSWTITTDSESTRSVFRMNSSGYVGDDRAYYDSIAVRPVLYLISRAEIIGGDGSSSNPFVIK